MILSNNGKVYPNTNNIIKEIIPRKIIEHESAIYCLFFIVCNQYYTLV